MSWLITYRKKGGRTEKLICLPSLKKLIDWIAKNGESCSAVVIQLVED